MDEKEFLKLSDRERDAFIAEAVFKRVPCDEWYEGNLGSMGGPVFYKDSCEHKSDECYPASEIEIIHGLLGGPRRYTTDWRWFGEGIEHANKNGFFAAVTSGETGNGQARVGNKTRLGYPRETIDSAILAFWIAYLNALGILD